MAPEQLFGERDLDHRIDVWSLGAMMFEMLTGRRPIEGENFGQIGKRMLADAIPSVAVERPDAPRALVELVDRMLRKERAERLDDLRLAADVLAPLATEPRPSFGAPVSPRPSSENDRVVVSSPRPADPVAETVAAPATGIAHVRSTSPSSRARWPWVLAAIVAAGGIGLTLRTRAPVAELPAASAQPDAPGVQPSPSAAPELPAPSVSTSVAPVASASPAPTKPASVKTTHVKTAASPSAAETAPAAAPSPSPSPSPSASLRGPAGLVTKPPF
jgi:serine/threonine protein kinase